jgi:hypothetical protein
MNRIYNTLSALPLTRKRYVYKFLFVVFIGIHIPLIALTLAMVGCGLDFNMVHALLLVLAFTLLATALTLFALNKLIAPVVLSAKVLEQYLEYKTLPTLPLQYQDEAGVLMQKLHYALNKIDMMGKHNKDLYLFAIARFAQLYIHLNKYK